MKTFFFIVVGIMGFALFFSCSPILSKEWELALSLRDVPKAAGDEIYAGDHFVNFLSESSAVAINYLNQFYVTKNAGQSWLKFVIPTNLRCQQPEPIDLNSILVGTPQGVVNFTVDGGKTWQRIEGSFGLMAINMLDNDQGLFYNWSKLFLYDRRSQTLNEVGVPENLGKGISCAALALDGVIFVLGQNGRFYKNDRKNLDWEELKLPVENISDFSFDYQVASLRFSMQGEGLLLVFNKKENGWALFYIKDAGLNFNYDLLLKGYYGRSAIAPNGKFITIMPKQAEEKILVLKRKS